MKIKKFIDISELYKRRVIIYSILFVSSVLNYSDTKFGFIITSLSIGYLSLITLSTLESSNSKLVLDNHISSYSASRIMQTLVQIGSFFGALTSGYFLTKINYNQFITCLCIFDIVVSLFGNLLYTEKKDHFTQDDSEVIEEEDVIISKKLKYLSIAIGLIGLHICAFNTLTPVLFQNVKNLSANYYGTCSGVAGVGAFLAAFINIKKFNFLLPSLILSVADIIFTQTNIPLLAVLVCFFIGFSINTIRINIRKEIIDETTTKIEADSVSKYSATIYTFSQSIGPLAFGLLTSNILLGVNSSVYLFPVVGSSIFIFIFFMQRGINQKCQKTQS
ncbi:hypothetical protein [Liberibacter crescens]|nr:hypothetical protein [Liberibacter crescens]